MSKDKRMTVNQTMNEVHKAYDFFEKCSWSAIELTLKEQCGFGSVRIERFKAEYMDKFGAETAAECERIRASLNRE